MAHLSGNARCSPPWCSCNMAAAVQRVSLAHRTVVTLACEDPLSVLSHSSSSNTALVCLTALQRAEE